MKTQNGSVAARVAALPALSTAELWSFWDRYFPRRPESPNRAYLESRIVQEEAYGGLAPETRKRLADIGSRHSKIRERRQGRDIYLAPGTVLVREYGSREHRVRVTAEGTFEYEGRCFKSLSAVARHIAGTPWSGPVFFGLRKPEDFE